MKAVINAILFVLFIAGSSRAGIREASCRIYVVGGSTGSGTYVFDRGDDTGIVFTCSHLFNESEQVDHCAFPSGHKTGAKLLYRDRAHDVAVISIFKPKCEPVPLGKGGQPGDVTVAGFGMNGRLFASKGRVVSRAMPAGATHPSSVLSCAVRSGDSGGGAFDDDGGFIGVIWGCDDNGMAYVTCGEPIQRAIKQTCHGRQQYGPPQQYDQFPPYQPQLPPPIVQTPPSEPPVSPEPTIDQAALEQFRTEITNEIKNEISVLVQNEIENVQACDCGPKWAALELRLSGIEGRITDQDANNEAIVIQLQQINATLAGLNNQPPAPSVPADPADEQYYYEIGPHTN